MKKFMIWAILFFPVGIFAANYGSVLLEKENVLRVADGQTFRVDINQWQSIIGQNIEVRVRGVDTPAIDGECDQENALAVEARNFLQKILMGAETIVLRDLDRGEDSFRLIGDVTVDGVDLGPAIVKAGLGQLLGGEEEIVWCDVQDMEIDYQGGTYTGEVFDGVPNGIGTWISLDGQQYEGEWQEGFWHGKGTYTATDGSTNTGEYQNGQRFGQSMWMHPDGRKYAGEYHEDKMHGKGAHTFSNGDIYVGAFENGKQHGEGTYTFSDGSVVAGVWQSGKPWQGAYEDASGQKIGQYVDGVWYAN